MQSIGRILNCWLWTQLKTFTVSHVRTLNQIKRTDFSTFKRSNCQEKKILGCLNFSEIIVKVFYITSAKPSCSNVTENVIFARNTSLSVSINWPILNGVDAKDSTFLFGHFQIQEALYQISIHLTICSEFVMTYIREVDPSSWFSDF